MINLAIVSPSTTNSPETFIQSHIKGITANVTHYYGDLVPRYSDKDGLFSINNENLTNRHAWGKVIRQINPIKFKNSKLNLKEYLFSRSLIKRHIDVVLAEYGTTSAEIVDCCKYAGIPLIAHFHGRDCSCYEVINKYKIKYCQLFHYATFVVAVSHYMEESLQQLGCNKEKIIYAPCTPDPLFTNTNIDFDNQILLFVGRFTDKKSPYSLVLSFRKIAEKFPFAQMIMAGDGPLLNSTKNLVKVLGLEMKIKFPGKISPLEMQELIAKSRAYVQHSITAEDGDAEGTPVSIMEASAAGLPVIATLHAGIPDVIIDGQTGLLSKELDIDTMAQNMERLLKNKEFAIKLGKNGKEFMARNYSKRWQLETLTNIVNFAASTKR